MLCHRMQKELFNKKGVSLTAIISLIVAVIVAALVILFASNFFAEADVTDNIDGDLAVISNKCQNAETIGGEPTFCGDFGPIKTSGKDNYINCRDVRLKEVVKNIKYTCEGAEERQCKELAKTEGIDMDKVLVNSEPCDKYLDSEAENPEESPQGFILEENR